MDSGVGRRTYHSGGTRFNALPAGAALPPPRSSPPRKTPSFETCRPGNSAPAATSRLPSPNSLKTSSVSLLSHEDRSPDPRLPEGPWYFSSRLVLLTPYSFRGSCRVRHPGHRMLVPCLAHCTCSVGTRPSGCWPSPWGQAALCPPQRSARRGTDHHFRSHYLGRGLPLGQMALPFPKECPESPCLTFASAASLRGTRVTPGLHADGFHCLQL